MHRVSTVLEGSTRRGPRRASATTPGCWPPHLLTAALGGRRPLRPINLRRVRTLTTELELNAVIVPAPGGPVAAAGGGRCVYPREIPATYGADGEDGAGGAGGAGGEHGRESRLTPAPSPRPAAPSRAPP